MRTRTVLLLTIHLLATAATSTAQPTTAESDAAWTAGDKGQGPGYAYQVFSQQKEGEPFVRYRVKGTVDATPEKLSKTAQTLSTDPSRAPEGQTRKVIVHNEKETVLHTSIDLPMMFTDRDIVTRGVQSADPNTGVRRIEFKSIEHPSVPKREGFLRLERTGGFWEFVPDGDQRSRVTLENHVDLGGSLPGWLVSGMMESNVVGNFEDVAKTAVAK